MKRRKAIGGILGITGICIVSLTGAKYYFGNLSYNKGNLEGHFDIITELVDVIIPPTKSQGLKSNTRINNQLL